MANRRNIGNISRIGRLSPTQKLSPRGGFETASIQIQYALPKSKVNSDRVLERAIRAKRIGP